MAGCQARTGFQLLKVSLFLHALLITSAAYQPVFEAVPTNIFQQHIIYSRHQPFCVVFRDTVAGSKLEKTIYDVWRNKDTQANYTNWEVTAFHTRENKLPVNTMAPKTSPAVRCYLGESSKYDYLGAVSKSAVKHWLEKLNARYTEQNLEVTPELVDGAKKTHDVVILAFPDGPRHYEVEDMVHQVATEVESSTALTVHAGTTASQQIGQLYGVKDYPSVVVIHRAGVETEEGHRVFEGLLVKYKVLITYITARSIPAPMLTTASFEKLLYSEESDRSFHPILVCFYNWWRDDTVGYLEAFNMTVNTFKTMGSHIRYGTVNIGDRSTKQLVKQYLQTGSMKIIPFLALFNKDVDGSVSHTVLNKGSPFPWIVYDQLERAGPDVARLYGIHEVEKPWGTVQPHEITPLYEGPYGHACSAWSHNMTDNTPIRRKVFTIKRKKLKKKKEATKIWHEMFATETFEKRLERHEGIPLITRSTWADVVEKSHSPKHVLYKSGHWAGEVTKITLVVFIMANCGSCRLNNATFREIQKSVAMIDGGAMYFVNCTAEKELCRDHNIRGFPTLVVFRGLGWMGTRTCISDSSREVYTNYARIDYHGIIQTNAVMGWFSTVAANAVTDMMFESLTGSFQDKNARLVGILMPRKTRFLPIPPHRNPDYYFKYECLRLICERLFSVIDCYTRYSSDIPQKEFTGKALDPVVTTILLQRRDGVSATITSVGEYLRETLENPSDTDLHRFHRPHRYNLGKNQKCEDNHAACVDVIADFTLDHSRLPITPVSSTLFHTATSRLKEEGLPILLALVYPENITESSPFIKELTAIAYEKYNDIIVMTIDAKKYSAWSGTLVPYQYGRLRVVDFNVPDPYSMYRYPRLCMVKKTDHKHAAFYPPIGEPRNADDVAFTFDHMLAFVNEYLKDPGSVNIETDQF